MTPHAYTGARIFDGEQLVGPRAARWSSTASAHRSAASRATCPTDARRVALGGGILVPGFIDLQVNGGGGALLNVDPTLDDDRDHLRRPCALRHHRACCRR